MPYKLSGNCVIKADSGATVKCHQTHAEAVAHLQALEANVPDAKELTTKAFLGYFEQSEVNYTALSPQIGTKACANCRFFMNNGCFIVESTPEPIIATGYCDRWEVGKVPAPPSVEPIPVTIVEPDMSMDDSAEM